MSNVATLRPPVASAAVITALINLGYLQHGQRHREERAVERLRRDPCIFSLTFGRNYDHARTFTPLPAAVVGR